MKLFTHVRDTYGQEGELELRKLVKTLIQLAHYRNDIRFNLGCKDLDMTLTSLCPKNHVCTQRGH